MSHTPGPWRQVRRSATIAIESADGDILGEVYGKTTRPETEWHANARLIAASPCLLAKLDQAVATITMLMDELCRYPDHEVAVLATAEQCRRNCYEAITKATKGD